MGLFVEIELERMYIRGSATGTAANAGTKPFLAQKEYSVVFKSGACGPRAANAWARLGGAES